MSEWVLAWGDHEWREADITVAHLVEICTGLGADTWDIAPTGGPIKLICVLAAFIAIATATTLPEVMAQLSVLPAETLLGALTIEPAATPAAD